MSTVHVVAVITAKTGQRAALLEQFQARTKDMVADRAIHILSPV